MRIIYLHGFASGPASRKAGLFRERFGALGREVEVPVLDGGDFENLTISGQLKVIEDTARGEAALLVGSSMGGYLAALYASRHPETRRLVLLAPAFGFVRRWLEMLGAASFANWERSGQMEVFHYGEGRSLPLSWRLIEDGRRFEDFPDFQQPALIIHGAQDTVVPPGLSLEFAASRPNVRVDIVQSDHELADVQEHIWERARPFLMEEE
jgi:hypothetical protein